MAHFRILIGTLALGLSFWCTSTYAVDNLPNPYQAFSLADSTPENQLPLLGDRFRIDDHIDEIVMVFFRHTHSKPIVLVLPDGSKWYSARHPESVQWESGPGFDQVRIKSPMRGPWQVSGDLRPESRLMVISDLHFNADPLPDLIFQGEHLRVQGRFTEAGEPIEQQDFRNAIEMTMHLVSTNDENYDNFGLNPRHVGDFLDDGRGLDARARDGEFTGEISFAVPTGPYLPSYRAKTPLYQRTFEQSPIMVEALPVAIEVDVATQEGQAHALHIEVDGSRLKLNDVIIRGQVEYPNGEVQLIDLNTAQGDVLQEIIPNYVIGIFKVDLRLYATLQADDREMVAQIPTYEFMARQPEPAGPTEEELAAERSREREARVQQQLDEEKAELRQQRTMFTVILVVNILLVALWAGFLMVRRTRRLAKPKDKTAKK